MRVLKFASILAILAALALGCGGEGKHEKSADETESADDLVEEGKLYLSYGEPDIARQKFMEALDLEPNHPLALYGVPIADSMHTFDVINIIIQYINMFLDPGFEDSKQTGSFDELIDSVLEGYTVDLADEAVEYIDTCLDAGAVEFDMDLPMPIIVDFEHLCDVQGRFAREELLVMWAFNMVWSGAIRHAIALNLDFDLSLAEALTDVNFDDIAAGIGEVVDILLQMLNDPGHPLFLTIEDGQVPTYQKAGRDLGRGLLKLNEAFWAITQKPPDNADDIFGYDDTNGNGQWDSGEPIRIPCEGVLDGDEMEWLYAILAVAVDMGNSFIDYSEYDPDPANPDPFDLATLNGILELLDLPPILPSVEIDFGANYVDPDPDALRDALIAILEFLDSILP